VSARLSFVGIHGIEGEDGDNGGVVGGPDVGVVPVSDALDFAAGEDLRGEHFEPGAFVIDEVDAVILRPGHDVDGRPCVAGGGDGIGVCDAVGIEHSGVGHSFARGPYDGADVVVEVGGCGGPVEMGGAVEVSGEDDGSVVGLRERSGHVGEDGPDFRETSGIGVFLQELFHRSSRSVIGGVGLVMKVAVINDHVVPRISGEMDASFDVDCAVGIFTDRVTADDLSVVGADGAVPAKFVCKAVGVAGAGFLKADDVGTGTGDGFDAFAAAVVNHAHLVPDVVAHDGEAGDVFLTGEEDRDVDGNVRGTSGDGAGGADGESVQPGIGSAGSAGDVAIRGDSKPSRAGDFLKGVGAVSVGAVVVFLREVGVEARGVGSSGDAVAEADRLGLPCGRGAGGSDGKGAGTGDGDICTRTTTVREKPCLVFAGRDDVAGDEGDGVFVESTAARGGGGIGVAGIDVMVCEASGCAVGRDVRLVDADPAGKSGNAGEAGGDGFADFVSGFIDGEGGLRIDREGGRPGDHAVA